MHPRIAVFCHMFHADLFAEVARYLSNIQRAVDIYLSTPTENHRFDLSRLFPNASIEVVPNRGRDIAPKFITFGPAHFGYDYVLHLHTKASIPGWRQHLFEHLVGSPERITAVLGAFERDARIGVITAEHFGPIRPAVNWGFNRPYGELLTKLIGVDMPNHVEFPAGSMFWARPQALKPIFDLGLTYDHFPPEPIPNDGTIAHALERMIFLSAIRAGYGWSLISDGRDGPRIDGPYFDPARPGWGLPPAATPAVDPSRRAHPLVRMSRRLQRSIKKRLGLPVHKPSPSP